MEDGSAPQSRRSLTPAIVASAVFTAACAVFAIAFVSARGGLELPLASRGPAAVASEAPTEAPSPPELTPPPPTIPPATPPPTVAATAMPTVTPTVAPTAAPTFVLPTLEPGDPLLALPECPDHPGCFRYTVARFDTLSGIISRYRLDIDVLYALNPGKLTDPSLIVVGDVLYLGRDPLARLDPCPGGEPCALYVVRAGDSLAEIADRYLTTRDAILTINPDLPRPIQAGQVIKLPRFALP